MHLLHLLHQYLPEHVGGTELYTQALSHSLQQRGHDVTIFHRRSAAKSGFERATEAGGNVYAAWNGPFQPTRRFLATFGDRTLAGAFRKALDEIRPDLVHIQHLMGLPTAVVAELRRRNIPYVVTLWDFWWVCANAQLLTNDSQQLCDGPRAFLNCARCALARAGLPQFSPALPLLALPLARRNQLLRQLLAGAARLIVPANFVRDWYAGHGIPTDRLVVIPPGLDYPPGLAARSLTPRGDNAERPFRIGYIGGLAPQKGVHILLEAFAGLTETAELRIAGDTSFDPAYMARLRQLAGPGVQFLGKLDRTAVWQMLNQVDVVVVTSLWYETFVFVISEAFAAGVPVIASDLGVLSERVRHEMDGLLVPPGDAGALRAALETLQQEPARLAALRQGIEPVHTLEQHVDAVEALYREVLRET